MNNNEKITRHLYYGLILLCVTAIVIYSSFLVTALIDKNKKASLDNVNNLEWYAIKSILDEEITKANLSSNYVATGIRSDLLSTYSDKNELGYDLEHISPDSKLFNVFSTHVKGVYLNNVQNDNNDIYILSPVYGIIFDLSRNCAVGEYPKSVSKEISIHNNPILVKIALQSIIDQSTNKYIFWNYLETPEKYSMIKDLNEMDIDRVKDIFYEYGLDGLGYLEFLSPTPVDQHGDILGVPDVSNVGVKNTNNKFIVVQGFNLKDAIDTVHPSFGLYYDNMREGMVKTYDFEKTVVSAISIIVYLALLTAFMSLLRNMNKTVL